MKNLPDLDPLVLCCPLCHARPSALRSNDAAECWVECPTGCLKTAKLPAMLDATTKWRELVLEFPLKQVAAALNLHPDEAKPRGLTWLHERRNWEHEVNVARNHAARLRDGLFHMLHHSAALKDGLESWYWQCRECKGTSPGVKWKPDADALQIVHKPDCRVPELRALIDTGAKPL